MDILMFFSWGLSKCLLRSSDCITIYGVVCTAAGNWGWNELFRRMKISFSKRMLVIAMATSVSAFVWFGYWFYAFNSYIVIPVLLLLIYRILTVISLITDDHTFHLKEIIKRQPSGLQETSIHLINHRIELNRIIVRQKNVAVKSCLDQHNQYTNTQYNRQVPSADSVNCLFFHNKHRLSDTDTLS